MSEAGSRKSSRRHAQGDWHRAEAALAALVVFCPLAIATVHPWAVATAAGLSLLALTLAGWATLRSGEPFLLPSPALAFAAVAAFIAFQLVPLPPPVVGVLAPRTRELFEFVLGPLGHYPAWRPLSLDPPATALELAKALTYLGAFLAAAQVVRSRRARTRLQTVLGTVGIVVAVIGFGHALWGATSLFGVFSFKQAAPPFLTPFGNPNHLASFLALSGTALLARVLTERDRKVATLWGFGYLATGVGVLLSLSRGGIVAFVAAQVMLAVAVWLVRQSEREGVTLRPRAFVVPGAVLLVLAVAAYVAWDALAAELASSDSLDKLKDSKVGMWPSFVPLVADHWLVGVGRGAFQSAYQRFQDPVWNTTFTHAENLVAQWVGDLGAPVGLFLIGSCAWALLGGLRRGADDPERLASVFGLAAVALHELVDFGLEFGGLAVPATVAFAVATVRQEGVRSVQRKAALGLIPVMAAAGALGLWLGRSTLDADGEALAAQVGKAKASEIEAAAVAMAVRHPADYFSHLVAAQAFAAERPMHAEKVVAFANRAMYLNPTLALPHRLAATALRATGRMAQARIEYKLAYQLRDATVLPEITRVFRRPEEVVDAVPDTVADLLRLADQLASEHRWEDAEAVARIALDRHGEKPQVLERLARLASARGQPDEQLRLGERLSAVDPYKTTGLHLRVEALLAKKQPDQALALLEGEGQKRFPLDPGVLLSLARLRLQLKDTKGCREALKRLPPGQDLGIRLAALSLEASAAEADGQGVKALALVRQGVTLRPEDPGWRWQYALLLERQGRLDQAMLEAATVADRGGGWKVEAEKLKARVAAKKKELEEAERWRELEKKTEP